MIYIKPKVIRNYVKRQLNLSYERQTSLKSRSSALSPEFDLVSLFNPKDVPMLKVLAFFYYRVQPPKMKTSPIFEVVLRIFPKLLKSLPRQTEKKDVISKSIRGTVNWSSTIRTWLNSAFDASKFRIEEFQRSEDSPETKLLFFLVYSMIDMLHDFKVNNATKFHRHELNLVLNQLEWVIGTSNKPSLNKFQIKNCDVLAVRRSRNPIFKTLIVKIYEVYREIFILDNHVVLSNFLLNIWSEIEDIHEIAEYYVLYSMFEIVGGKDWYTKGTYAISEDYIAKFNIKSTQVTFFFKQPIERVVPISGISRDIIKLKPIYKGFNPRALNPDIILKLEDQSNKEISYIILEVKNTSLNNKPYVYTGIYKADYYKHLYNNVLGFQEEDNKIKCVCFINEGLDFEENHNWQSLTNKLINHNTIVIPFKYIGSYSSKIRNYLLKIILNIN